MADVYARFACRAAASIVVSTAHRLGDHGTLSPPGSSTGKDGGDFLFDSEGNSTNIC